jgi:hypothetical protein
VMYFSTQKIEVVGSCETLVGACLLNYMAPYPRRP